MLRNATPPSPGASSGPAPTYVRSDRERLFELSARLTLRLLGAGDLDITIREGLAELGEGTGADRVYVFENHPDPSSGAMLSSQCYEWTAEGIASEMENPQLRGLNLDESIPFFAETMRAGGVLRAMVEELPPQERAMLSEQGVLSVLIVPIVVNEAFWGFLGFDAVRAPRDWAAAEEQVLRVVATTLGTGIERRRNEIELRQAAAVFEGTRDAVLVTDLEGRITAVNAAQLRLTGYTREELIGQPSRMLDTDREDEAFYRRVWASLHEHGFWSGENWNRCKDGQVFPQWLTISAVGDASGAPTHYVGVGTDISQLKRNEAQLQFLADHDVLTRLPNRRLAQTRLEQAILAAQADSRHVAVLFIDLDRFKALNDSLGHPVGDEILREVARRMLDRLRSSDLLARIGGDEFLVLLSDAGGVDAACSVAEGLLHRLRDPIDIAGREVYLGASVGISLFPDHGSEALDLVRNADVAMYQAKRAGRDRVRVYSPEMAAGALGDIELEAQVRRAIDRDGLHLHYQPRLDLRSGRVTGVEALLRVDDGQGGYLRADEVVRLGEGNGLIVPIGTWAIHEACRQLFTWQRAGLDGLMVAVNVSARQFYAADELVRVLLEALEAYAIEPACLELEITETLLMDSPAHAAEVLGRVRALGIKVALDDFGTGYSSLSYLMRFPIDRLKIDRGFLASLPGDPRASAIASTIIGLAHQLDLEVVAEGVERREQLEFLRAQGCDAMQGYLFSPAVPADQVPALMARLLD